MQWRGFAGTWLFATAVVGAAGANSWDLGPGLTGAPGTDAPEPTCVACHASAPLNPDADASLELRGLPEHYVPGVRYRVTLELAHPDETRLRWGFELTAVAAQRPGSAGRLVVTDRQNTRRVSGRDGRRYLTHTYPGTGIGRSGGRSWTFDWVAPLMDVGEVAFFASAVAADADGSERGDRVYGPAPAALAVTSGPSARAEGEEDAAPPVARIGEGGEGGEAPVRAPAEASGTSAR